MTKKHLAIPATSTLPERVFSVAGIVVDKRCAVLTPEMMDALVFLNKNGFFLGLTKECSSNQMPDLTLQIDEPSDNKELGEDLGEIHVSDVDEIVLDESGSKSDESE